VSEAAIDIDADLAIQWIKEFAVGDVGGWRTSYEFNEALRCVLALAERARASEREAGSSPG
jgi:hypothetical protein